MNKVESVEKFSEGSKPVEMLSEEEKKTPSEMYPDEITTELEEGDLEKKPSEEKVEPKEEVEPVEGEIPEAPPKSSDDTEDREIKGLKAQEEKLKAQILERVVSLRSQNRQLKEQLPISQPSEIEGVDPEVEKQLDAILQKKGYAPETQIRQKIQQESLEKDLNRSDRDFLTKYPEYLYSAELREELNEIVDAKPADSLEEYERRLKLAHDIVKSNHPDRFPSSGGADAVKKQALKTAGLGAGSQSAPSSTRPRLDPVEVERAKRFYKGFTDDEIAELLNK